MVLRFCISVRTIVLNVFTWVMMEKLAPHATHMSFLAANINSEQEELCSSRSAPCKTFFFRFINTEQ